MTPAEIIFSYTAVKDTGAPSSFPNGHPSRVSFMLLSASLEVFEKLQQESMNTSATMPYYNNFLQ